jgi:hypothetical protein
MFSGTRGLNSVESWIQVVMIGVAVTMLLNLIRVAAAAAVAATVGVGPAVFFHDYDSAVMVIGFLFGFWIFIQRWILVAPASEPDEVVA